MEVDLHIAYSKERYEGENFVTCQVTYPPRAPHSAITIEYAKPNELGWDDGKFIERASADIAKYIEDPEEWTREYIERSSDTARKLAQARHDLLRFQRWAADAERDLQKYQQRLREAEQTIAALQKEQDEKKG